MDEQSAEQEIQRLAQNAKSDTVCVELLTGHKQTTGGTVHKMLFGTFKGCKSLPKAFCKALVSERPHFVFEVDLSTYTENDEKIVPDFIKGIGIGPEGSGATHARAIVTDETLIFIGRNSGHLPGIHWYDWDTITKVRYTDIKEVFYGNRQPIFLQIHTENDLYHLRLWGDYEDELRDAAGYIANQAGLGESYEVTGSVTDIVDCPESIKHRNNWEKEYLFTVGWSVEQREWSPKDDKKFTYSKKTNSEARTEEWKRAHEEASQRPIPVEIGDVLEFGIEEFKSHPKRGRNAVCRTEGFVVFVYDVPPSLDKYDTIRAKITSINNKRSSASAGFIEKLD